MNTSTKTRSQKSLPYRILCLFLSFSVFSSAILPPSHAQSVLNLPLPGSMVGISPSFVPIVIKGIKVFADNPFRFEFIMDTGNASLNPQELNRETRLLIKYFLTALTVPDDDQWVNLSPYENDRIIPNEFGTTEMGRDLLAQDYLFKQLTASLVYPEHELGKKFWERVYQKAYEKFGTTDIPVSTFNKVWVLPDHARVYEYGTMAVITESHLKVMLEEDYLAFTKDNDLATQRQMQMQTNDDNSLGSQVMREVIIPEIEKEINEGRNFAKLRQIYQSLIMAAWFKRKLKNSILSKMYVGTNKVAGVDVDDKEIKQKIYEQYIKAYKKGVYNYVKEEMDESTQEVIPRKYFSGGVVAGTAVDNAMTVTPVNTLNDLVLAGGTSVGESLKASVRLDTMGSTGRGVFKVGDDLTQSPAGTTADRGMAEDQSMLSDERQKEIDDLSQNLSENIKKGILDLDNFQKLLMREEYRNFVSKLLTVNTKDEKRYLAQSLERVWPENLGSVYDFVAMLVGEATGKPEQVKANFEWIYGFLDAATATQRAQALATLVLSNNYHLRGIGLHPEGDDDNESRLGNFKYFLDNELLLGKTSEDQPLLQRYLESILELNEDDLSFKVNFSLERGGRSVSREDVLLWTLVLAIDPSVHLFRQDAMKYVEGFYSFWRDYWGEDWDQLKAPLKFLNRAFANDRIKAQWSRIEPLIIKALSITEDQWRAKGLKSPYRADFREYNLRTIIQSRVAELNEDVAGQFVDPLYGLPVENTQLIESRFQKKTGEFLKGDSVGYLKSIRVMDDGYRPIYKEVYTELVNQGVFDPKLVGAFDDVVLKGADAFAPTRDVGMLGREIKREYKEGGNDLFVFLKEEITHMLTKRQLAYGEVPEDKLLFMEAHERQKLNALLRALSNYYKQRSKASFEVVRMSGINFDEVLRTYGFGINFFVEEAADWGSIITRGQKAFVLYSLNAVLGPIVKVVRHVSPGGREFDIEHVQNVVSRNYSFSEVEGVNIHGKDIVPTVYRISNVEERVRVSARLAKDRVMDPNNVNSLLDTISLYGLIGIDFESSQLEELLATNTEIHERQHRVNKMDGILRPPPLALGDATNKYTVRFLDSTSNFLEKYYKLKGPKSDNAQREFEYLVAEEVTAFLAELGLGPLSIYSFSELLSRASKLQSKSQYSEHEVAALEIVNRFFKFISKIDSRFDVDFYSLEAKDLKEILYVFAKYLEKGRITSDDFVIFANQVFKDSFRHNLGEGRVVEADRSGTDASMSTPTRDVGMLVNEFRVFDEGFRYEPFDPLDIAARQRSIQKINGSLEGQILPLVPFDDSARSRNLRFMVRSSINNATDALIQELDAMSDSVERQRIINDARLNLSVRGDFDSGDFAVTLSDTGKGIDRLVFNRWKVGDFKVTTKPAKSTQLEGGSGNYIRTMLSAANDNLWEVSIVSKRDGDPFVDQMIQMPDGQREFTRLLNPSRVRGTSITIASGSLARAQQSVMADQGMLIDENDQQDLMGRFLDAVFGVSTMSHGPVDLKRRSGIIAAAALCLGACGGKPSESTPISTPTTSEPTPVSPIDLRLQALYRGVKAQQNSTTGLVPSYGQTNDLKLTENSHTYDMALGVIMLLANKDLASARRIMDFYIREWNNPQEGALGLATYYETATGRFGLDGKLIMTGINAWMAIAAIELFDVTGENQYLEFADKIAQRIQGTRHLNGGVAMGPVDSTDVQWTKIFSTEHNIDYASLLMKLLVRQSGLSPNRKVSIEAELNGVKTWIKERFNPATSILNRGVNDLSGVIQEDPIKALDTTTFFILTFGPQRIKTDFGFDPQALVLMAEQYFGAQADVSGAARAVLGFDFTDVKDSGFRLPLVWFEGTAQMVAVYDVMSKWEGVSESKRQEYRAKAEKYKEEIALASRETVDGIAVPYINSPVKLRPFIDANYFTPEGSANGFPAFSMASTTWNALAISGINPMRDASMSSSTPTRDGAMVSGGEFKGVQNRYFPGMAKRSDSDVIREYQDRLQPLTGHTWEALPAKSKAFIRQVPMDDLVKIFESKKNYQVIGFHFTSLGSLTEIFPEEKLFEYWNEIVELGSQIGFVGISFLQDFDPVINSHADFAVVAEMLTRMAQRTDQYDTLQKISRALSKVVTSTSELKSMSADLIALDNFGKPSFAAGFSGFVYVFNQEETKRYWKIFIDFMSKHDSDHHASHVMGRALRHVKDALHTPEDFQAYAVALLDTVKIVPNGAALLHNVTSVDQITTLNQDLLRFSDELPELYNLIALVPGGSNNANDVDLWTKNGFDEGRVKDLVREVLLSGVVHYRNILSRLKFLEYVGNPEHDPFRQFVTNPQVPLAIRMNMVDTYAEILAVEKLIPKTRFTFIRRYLPLSRAHTKAVREINTIFQEVSTPGLSVSKQRKLADKENGVMFRLRKSVLENILERKLSDKEARLIQDREVNRKVMTLVSIVTSLEGAYFNDLETMRKQVRNALREFFSAYQLTSGMDAVLKANQQLNEYVMNLAPNQAVRKELEAAGYSPKLWSEGVDFEMTVNGGITEETKRRNIQAATNEFMEIAIDLGIKKVNGRDVSLDWASELDTYEKASQFLEGMKAFKATISNASQLMLFNERLAYLNNVLYQIRGQDGKKVIGDLESTKFRVTIKKDFLNEAMAGLGVPGCYAPAGIHREMPLVHAFESNAGFIQVYSENGKQVANAVIVYTKDGVYVDPIHSSTFYDMEQVFGQALTQLTQYVPKLVLASTSAGYLYFKQQGIGVGGWTKLIKPASIFTHQYFDSGYVGYQGQLELEIERPLIVTRGDVQPAKISTETTPQPVVKKSDIDFQKLADKFIEKGERYKKYLFLIKDIKKKITLEGEFAITDDFYDWIGALLRDKPGMSNISDVEADEVADIVLDFLEAQEWPFKMESPPRVMEEEAQRGAVPAADAAMMDQAQFRDGGMMASMKNTVAATAVGLAAMMPTQDVTAKPLENFERTSQETIGIARAADYLKWLDARKRESTQHPDSFHAEVYDNLMSTLKTKSGLWEEDFVLKDSFRTLDGYRIIFEEPNRQDNKVWVVDVNFIGGNARISVEDFSPFIYSKRVSYLLREQYGPIAITSSTLALGLYGFWFRNFNQFRRREQGPVVSAPVPVTLRYPQKDTPPPATIIDPDVLTLTTQARDYFAAGNRYYTTESKGYIDRIVEQASLKDNINGEVIDALDFLLNVAGSNARHIIDSIQKVGKNDPKYTVRIIRAIAKAGLFGQNVISVPRNLDQVIESAQLSPDQVKALLDELKIQAAQGDAIAIYALGVLAFHRQEIIEYLPPETIDVLKNEMAGLREVLLSYDQNWDAPDYMKEEKAYVLVHFAELIADRSPRAARIVEARPIIDKLIKKIEERYLQNSDVTKRIDSLRGQKRILFGRIFEFTVESAKSKNGKKLSETLANYYLWQELDLIRPLTWAKELGDEIIQNRISHKLGQDIDDRPRAIAIFSKEDWNGAFDGDNNNLSELVKNYHVLYYEVSSVQEMIAALKDGSRDKQAEVVLIAGHGTSGTVNFGFETQLDSKLILAHEEMLKTQGLEFVMVPGGRFILKACSTGCENVEGGNMADMLARVLNVIGFGPKKGLGNQLETQTNAAGEPIIMPNYTDDNGKPLPKERYLAVPPGQNTSKPAQPFGLSIIERYEELREIKRKIQTEIRRVTANKEVSDYEDKVSSLREKLAKVNEDMKALLVPFAPLQQGDIVVSALTNELATIMEAIPRNATAGLKAFPGFIYKIRFDNAEFGDEKLYRNPLLRPSSPAAVAGAEQIKARREENRLNMERAARAIYDQMIRELDEIQSPRVQAQVKDDVGGIDMNQRALDLQTEGESVSFDIPFDPAQWQNIQFDGFTPVILEITPTSLPVFIGASDSEKPIQLSSV